MGMQKTLAPTRCKMLANMMDACNADVLAYDSVNYGLSSRAITAERNMQQAVEAVFNVAISDLCIPANRIVLYGKSIGTAPTLYLAAQRCADEILGVIVVAPLASGIRALMHTTYIPNTLLKQLDRAFCPSIEYIEKIRRPVFYQPRPRGHGDRGRKWSLSPQQAQQPLALPGPVGTRGTQ